MTNRVYNDNDALRVLKSGLTNGQGFAIGGVKGVVQAAADSNNEATVELNSKRKVFRFSVVGGTDDSSPSSAGSAVAFGDTLYVNMTTGVVSKDSSGTVLFGYALGNRNSRGAYDTTATLVASGATTAIDVLLAA
jgi:hypothetical protein